jgi:predicted helicase
LPGGKRGAFWAVSHAGKQLAELHLHYEQQPEYPLQKVATPGMKPHYRIDKMRLSKEKDTLIYNDAFILTGIPPEVFDYRLGNRSALEWVIDQYQVTIDGQSGNRDKVEWLNDYQAKTVKGSGILNDPNRRDDEQYILRLIGQVMTVSLETMKIVKGLAESVQFT